MNRTNLPSENPNHFVGCHPASRFEELDPSRNEPTVDRSIPSSRFTSASFYDGVILWKQQPSLRRQALDRVIARVIRHKVPGEEHVLSYLQHMYRRNCRPKTICSTASSLTLILLFVKQRGKQYLELIVRQDLEAFVEQEQDRGIKPKTIHFRLQNLYAFFRYLVKENVIGPELIERKIRLRVPQSLPKAICTPDILRLLAVLDHTRDRAMILTLLRTGMRIGELLSLRGQSPGGPRRVETGQGGLAGGCPCRRQADPCPSVSRSPSADSVSCLVGLKEDDLPIPDPTSFAEIVEVALWLLPGRGCPKGADPPRPMALPTSCGSRWRARPYVMSSPRQRESRRTIPSRPLLHTRALAPSAWS